MPSTYLPYAATVYQEGMHFPCVRIQEGFEDKKDIIRMARHKIRVPHIWYGDYRAQVGACRTGERRLKELADRYGKETIKNFVESWMDYGRRRAVESRGRRIARAPRRLDRRRPGPVHRGLHRRAQGAPPRGRARGPVREARRRRRGRRLSFLRAQRPATGVAAVFSLDAGNVPPRVTETTRA